MTDCDSAVTKDETSTLCPSPDDFNTLIDEIPSLDALSFEREHCPSRNCLCHNRKHLQNNRNGSGLTAFGVRSSGTPILAQNSASMTFTKDPLSSMPVGQPAFQSLINGRSIVADTSTDAVPATNVRDQVFGIGSESCHYNGDRMQSFAQLCPTVPSSTSESAAISPPLTFQHGHRGGQLPKDPTHSVQSINLLELQSVLPVTTGDSLPESSCPIHRPASAVQCIHACTCGQQASRLDDCTFDELAAYFDNFCYIPKNMSPMAEMMYM